MAFKASALKDFETHLNVFTGQMLPEQARQALIEGAQATKARVESEQRARSGGIAPTVTPIVDGNRGAPFSAAGANSVILLDWNYLQEAVATVVAYLRKHAPVVKGDWKASIGVEVDGRLVDPAAPIPREAKDAYVYVNTPYARRLEIGKDESGGPFVTQVPMHFVEQSVLLFRSSMKSLATFKFTFVPMERTGWRQVGLKANRVRHHNYERRLLRKAEQNSRVPAIFIQEIQGA